ncbi:MAG: hypothetical protein HY459_01755 [Parcubacteria group bacterium]|nr:hypothetical protein [Parcubacteria group bacterium]
MDSPTPAPIPLHKKLAEATPVIPRTQVVSATLTGLAFLSVVALVAILFQPIVETRTVFLFFVLVALLAVTYYVFPRIPLVRWGYVVIDAAFLGLITFTMWLIEPRLAGFLLFILVLIVVMADLSLYTKRQIAILLTLATLALGLHNWYRLGPSAIGMTVFEALVLSLFVIESRRYAIQQFDLESQRQKVEDYITKLLTVNKQLAKVEREKNEFISFASHQLKTPIAAVKWAFQYLLDGDAGTLTDAQRDILIHGARANTKMLRFVDELLGVVRMADQETRAHESVKVTALLEEIKTFLTTGAVERGLHLTWNEDAGLGETLLNVNPLAVKHAIMNVADNALTYTPRGKKIVVSVSRKHRMFLLTIRDEGIGIPKGDQKRIFERFFRARNATSQENIGSGLGLYLTKRIIDGHGGSVTIESEENQGTTVTITLPIATN